MPDREKVVKGLTLCSDKGCDCCGCPYYPYDKDKDFCIDRLERDALALLREQDSVEYALAVLKKHGWKDDSEVTG